MKRLTLTWPLILLILNLTAASTMAFEQGNEAIQDSLKTSQLLIGKTTKAEVRALFGEPGSVTTRADGWEKWIYTYVNIKIFAARRGESASLGVIFDDRGILQQKSLNR